MQRQHDLAAEGQPECGQQEADGQEGQEGCGHGQLHPAVLLRAEVPADDDGGPHASAHGDADEDIGEGVAGPHGGQGVLPHQAAHDGGVGHGIGLLEEIAYDHGQGEYDQGAERLFLCEVVVFHVWGSLSGIWAMALEARGHIFKLGLDISRRDDYVCFMWHLTL